MLLADAPLNSYSPMIGKYSAYVKVLIELRHCKYVAAFLDSLNSYDHI